MRRGYRLATIASVALATMALSDPDAATARGVHHIGSHGPRFGGAMPGSGHHGGRLFGARLFGGCRRCR